MGLGPPSQWRRTDWSDRTTSIALVTILVTATVVGSIALVGGGPVGAQDSAAVGYEGNTLREVRAGDVVLDPWTVIFTDTKNATIVFTGARNTEHDIWANLTVHDDDGDGRLQLYLNTWQFGHENPWRVEGGSILNWSGPSWADDRLLNRTLDGEQPSYELYISAGTDPESTLQAHSATARLFIDEAELTEIEAATAPKGLRFDRMGQLYDEPDRFADLYPNMSSERDGMLNDGDTMLILPSAEGGMFGPLQAALERRDSKVAALLWLLEHNYYNFTLEQKLPNKTGKVLDVEYALEQGALDFAGDQRYGHLAFGLSTDAEVFQVGGEGEYVDMQTGERYMASYDRGIRADPDPENQGPVTRNYTVIPLESETQSPVVTLAEGELGGDTTLAPGTDLTLYVVAGGENYEIDAVVETIPGIRDALPPVETGIERHPWNISVNFTDVDASEVQLSVWAEGYGRISAFPPGASIPHEPEPTTTTTPANGETTTAAATTTAETTTATATTTTDASAGDGDGGPSDGDAGDGGGIPGFTATLALLALAAAGLIAAGRR